jgi:hypothetical protein
VKERVAQGSWVELHRVVLEPGERAPQVPAETQRVPLELRVKGFLAHEAALGEEAEIVTAAGRRLRGELACVNPAYEHGFGPPVPQLAGVGEELRALLRGAAEEADES